MEAEKQSMIADAAAKRKLAESDNSEAGRCRYMNSLSRTPTTMLTADRCHTKDQTADENDTRQCRCDVRTMHF